MLMRVLPSHRHVGAAPDVSKSPGDRPTPGRRGFLFGQRDSARDRASSLAAARTQIRARRISKSDRSGSASNESQMHRRAHFAEFTIASDGKGAPGSRGPNAIVGTRRGVRITQPIYDARRSSSVRFLTQVLKKNRAAPTCRAVCAKLYSRFGLTFGPPQEATLGLWAAVHAARRRRRTRHTANVGRALRPSPWRVSEPSGPFCRNKWPRRSGAKSSIRRLWPMKSHGLILCDSGGRCHRPDHSRTTRGLLGSFDGPVPGVAYDELPAFVPHRSRLPSLPGSRLRCGILGDEAIRRRGLRALG
jgi:hypothetical protein